jgi:hypothetical protein
MESEERGREGKGMERGMERMEWGLVDLDIQS